MAWMSKEWRQSWNLLEPRIFDIYKNTTAPMIAILDCSEIDIEVSDMKTMETNDCIEVSEDDRDANGMLAVMWEGARFSCKDR